MSNFFFFFFHSVYSYNDLSDILTYTIIKYQYMYTTSGRKIHTNSVYLNLYEYMYRENAIYIYTRKQQQMFQKEIFFAIK